MIDLSHVDDYEPFQLNENLSYEEKSVQILGREAKTLRNRAIMLVKDFWQNHHFEEATWGQEDEMRTKYPELFQD